MTLVWAKCEYYIGVLYRFKHELFNSLMLTDFD